MAAVRTARLRRAFTLIELLVVIAIIALLIGRYSTQSQRRTTIAMWDDGDYRPNGMP